jgi:hypothetical protein
MKRSSGRGRGNKRNWPKRTEYESIVPSNLTTRQWAILHAWCREVLASACVSPMKTPTPIPSDLRGWVEAFKTAKAKDSARFCPLGSAVDVATMREALKGIGVYSAHLEPVATETGDTGYKGV